jgi:hypothetical protein
MSGGLSGRFEEWLRLLWISKCVEGARADLRRLFEGWNLCIPIIGVASLLFIAAPVFP